MDAMTQHLNVGDTVRLAGKERSAHTGLYGVVAHLFDHSKEVVIKLNESGKGVVYAIDDLELIEPKHTQEFALPSPTGQVFPHAPLEFDAESVLPVCFQSTHRN
jgi:hypothetical protein